MKHCINIIYALLAFVLFSCSSTSEEPSVTPPAGEEPSVTPTVSTKWTFHYSLPAKDSQATRAAGDEFQLEQLDKSNFVGLFCVKSDGTFHFDNLKYKAGDEGTLVPDEGVETPDKPSSNCKIIACAPYGENFQSLKENITFPVKLDQTTSDGLMASDLLWGEADADVQLNDVDIRFQRVLPRWMLTITIGGGLQPKDFQGATIGIYKVLTQVGFNAKTGETDGNPSEQGNIDFLKIADGNQAEQFVGTVMLPPQTDRTCYLRIIFKDGVKLYFKFAPTDFKQGRLYYSDVQLTGYPNNIKAEIKSWEEENYNGYIKGE